LTDVSRLLKIKCRVILVQSARTIRNYTDINGLRRSAKVDVIIRNASTLRYFNRSGGNTRYGKVIAEAVP